MNEINDLSSLHRYRTEIPNLIDEMDLSVYAFRLYVRLKRVAGDGGKCFYSTRQLAEQCRMSVGAVSNAKQELIEKDLIRIDRSGDWDRDNITLVDVWPANFAYYAQEKQEVPCSPHEQNTPIVCSPHEQKDSQPVHHMNRPVHTVNTPVHHMNTKEEPIKKEPLKEEPIAESLPAAKDATPQQEMFAAVCEAIGWDYHTLTEGDRGQVGQACGILKKAKYSVEDIRRFMVDIWFKDWRWEKNGQHPTLKQLRQEIGKIRSTLPSVAPPPKEKGIGGFRNMLAEQGIKI